MLFLCVCCVVQNPEDHELKPESMDVQISPTHQSFASPASPLARVSHSIENSSWATAELGPSKEIIILSSLPVLD